MEKKEIIKKIFNEIVERAEELDFENIAYEMQIFGMDGLFSLSEQAKLERTTNLNFIELQRFVSNLGTLIMQFEPELD